MTITLTREEAQQVLECMETAIKAGDWVVDGACDPDFILYMLRNRLAQPEPETCGYDETTGNCTQNPCCYPASPQLEPSVEPVADKYLMEVECTKCGAKQDGILTVTAPPQREWQGLTAYEIQELHLANSNWGNFACAIESKLKEKNR